MSVVIMRCHDPSAFAPVSAPAWEHRCCSTLLRRAALEQKPILEDLTPELATLLRIISGDVFDARLGGQSALRAEGKFLMSDHHV